MSTIEIVFFDAGETILHPHPSFPELFARTCRESGHVVDADLVGEIQERLAPHLVELATESGMSEPSLSEEASLRFWSHLYRRLLAELGIEDEGMIAELYRVFSDSRSYKLFGDAAPALRQLDEEGYRLSLISNFEGWLEKMLVELEVGDVFDVSVISGLAGVEKPDRRIYEIALERAEVDPSRAVHVGDSPKMDAEPAEAVGMRPILLDRRDRYPDSPYPRIASLEELSSLLKKQ